MRDIVWTLNRVSLASPSVAHAEIAGEYRGTEREARKRAGLSAEAWKHLRAGGTVSAGADAYLLLSVQRAAPPRSRALPPSLVR